MLGKGHGDLCDASTKEEESKKRKAKRREGSDRVVYNPGLPVMPVRNWSHS